MGKYEAGKTLQEIEKHGVTTLFAVPTQIQEMLFHPEFKNFDVSTLKMITTGGAAISSTTMERVIKELCPRIFNGYGMTEASLTLLLRPEDTLAKLGACGKPTLITDCRIIVNDPDPRRATNRNSLVLMKQANSLSVALKPCRAIGTSRVKR